MEIAARLLKRQAKGPRPRRKRNGLVDKCLADLIESCLATDPELRPASAGYWLPRCVRSGALPAGAPLDSRSPRVRAGCRRGGTADGRWRGRLSRALPSLRCPPVPAGARLLRGGPRRIGVRRLNASLVANPRQSGASSCARFKRRGDFKLAFADYDPPTSWNPRRKSPPARGSAWASSPRNGKRLLHRCAIEAATIRRRC